MNTNLMTTPEETTARRNHFHQPPLRVNGHEPRFGTAAFSAPPPISVPEVSSGPAGASTVETLDQKMRMVISHLSDNIRMSKLIALNISLLAMRGEHNLVENNAAIQVVAREIQLLSEKSVADVDELHAILTRVKLLSRTINTAGRQRMLSQKIAKLFLIQRLQPSAENQNELNASVADFHATLKQLKRCELNNPEISAHLNRAEELLKHFIAAIENNDVTGVTGLTEQVLGEMHKIVQQYEALSSN